MNARQPYDWLSAMPVSPTDSLVISPARSSARLDSLDTLRGMDMAMILGLDAVVHELHALFPQSAFWQTLAEQMSHVPWEGLHVYDLVFPVFVFLAGVSMALSFRRRLENGVSRGQLAVSLWKRAAVLVVLGWLVNGPLGWKPEEMRYASVLGLIGLSCALGGSLMLLGRGRARLAAGLALCLMLLTGVLQYAGGDFSPAGSVNAKIDALLCPGVLYGGCYDPEGLLAIVSASALNLLGFVCGKRVAQETVRTWRTVAVWSAWGALLLVAAAGGPVIKNMWTPFFTAAAAGAGFLLMALAYAVVDLKGRRAWSYPFRAIGANALSAYLLLRIIPFGELNDRIFGQTAALLLPVEYRPLALSLTAALLAWLLLAWLYRNKIFIKI